MIKTIVFSFEPPLNKEGLDLQVYRDSKGRFRILEVAQDETALPSLEALTQQWYL